jgi:hypothetical protein
MIVTFRNVDMDGRECKMDITDFRERADIARALNKMDGVPEETPVFMYGSHGLIVRKAEISALMTLVPRSVFTYTRTPPPPPVA